MKEAWQYGEYYWCIVLVDGARFFFWADEVEWCSDDVVFKSWKVEGAMYRVATFNRNQVAYWYWANPINGEPVCGKSA